MNDLVYNPFNISGVADDPTDSEVLGSFVKTGTDMAFGLGGKALSVDDSTSVGLTIGAAILSMGVGYAFDRFVTTPYITKVSQENLYHYRNPIDDLTILVNAYHGYKRNDGSYMNALGWAISSVIAGPELTGIALAQGFGKNIK